MIWTYLLSRSPLEQLSYVTRTCLLNRHLVFAAALFFVPPTAAADVTQAIKHSQQTGKPIFAVAGASYCPSCVKLMNTLNTDESLRPYIDQFVPLKINAQSDDYQRWKQFFPPKRAAIPALFIVTPQGKELYSAVGALPTKSLQKVMLTSLEKAERYPTKQQWDEIAKSIESAERALEANEIDQAAESLLPTLGRLERMGSLLQLADEGRETVASIEELAEKQQALLDRSLQSLVSKGDYVSAIEVAALEQMLSALPQQRKAAAATINRAVRDADLKKILRQARELRQAETMAKQSEPKLQRRAVATLKRIAKRNPDTELATRAQQQLQTLSN